MNTNQKIIRRNKVKLPERKITKTTNEKNIEIPGKIGEIYSCRVKIEHKMEIITCVTKKSIPVNEDQIFIDRIRRMTKLKPKEKLKIEYIVTEKLIGKSQQNYK